MPYFELLTLAAGLVGVTSLVLFARIQWRESRRRFYVYVGSMVFVVLATIALRQLSLHETFLWTAVVGPALLFAFTQIPLVAFRNRKESILPSALLILSIVLLTSDVAANGSSSISSWREEAVFLTGMIGIFPLIASAALLMKAGWAVGKWWGIGLNPVTSAAVLPAFLLAHPREGWPAARRFFFWITVTFGLALVDAILRERDPLYPIGVVLFSVGGLATMGTVTWLLVAAVRGKMPVRERWRAVKQPAIAAGAAAAVCAIGILLHGDLIIDRNAMTATTRSWSDRAMGCGGSRHHAVLLMELSKRCRESLLEDFRFNPGEGATGPAAAADDLLTATTLAKAAILVYSPSYEILTITQRWNQPDLRVIPLGFGPAHQKDHRDCSEGSSRDQAVILADGRNVVVAFRGTNQFADWATNLSVLPEHWLTARWTHGGFSDSLERLWPELADGLQRVRDNDQPVWLTGHSLGGALAVLAADRLQEAGVTIGGVYTFGQPRVGGEAVARLLRARFPNYNRFVMHRDVVPTLGSPTALHTGRLHYIDTLGALHSGVDWKLNLRDVGCSGVFGPIESHGMVHYLSVLQLAAVRARAGLLRQSSEKLPEGP